MLKPLRQQLSTLKRNVSRKYHQELELADVIEENGIDDLELIEAERNLINEVYGDLPSQIAEIENKIANAKILCENATEKRLSEVFGILDLEAKRDVILLVKNKFEVDREKNVKLTFKSAFRKIRKR